MNADLGLVLQITLVGMGLVFAAILLLWGGMALLVRLMAHDEATGDVIPGSASDARERKRRAAAAAVSLALAQRQQSHQVHPFPLPPTALVSAWQAVRRSNQLQRRGPR